MEEYSMAGAPFKFTPDEFEAAWEEYFRWCDENPWMKNEAVKSGDSAGMIIQVPTPRPYSEMGFIAYHGLGENYLNQLSKSVETGETEEKRQLSWVLTRMRAKCRAQKFEGATVGAFNANIIARDLGMVDKKDITTGGDKITGFKITDVDGTSI